MGFDELKDKAKNVADEHPEQTEKFTDQANEQAGDRIDQATGGKHAQQVDKAQQKADDAIGN